MYFSWGKEKIPGAVIHEEQREKYQIIRDRKLSSTTKWRWMDNSICDNKMMKENGWKENERKKFSVIFHGSKKENKILIFWINFTALLNLLYNLIALNDWHYDVRVTGAWLNSSLDDLLALTKILSTSMNLLFLENLKI